MSGVHSESATSGSQRRAVFHLRVDPTWVEGPMSASALNRVRGGSWGSTVAAPILEHTPWRPLASDYALYNIIED
jgi:hypothetical protein